MNIDDTDSELEDDEEEILVYVEFESCATNNIFTAENLKLDMIGLDSDHPVMQVNGKFYEGSYEDVAGTYMFFEKNEDPQVDDPVCDVVPALKYVNKTRKILKMQRAFVIPRFEVIGDSDNKECIPNVETLKEAGVPMKYQENALSFWKTIRDGRMEALNTYMEKQKKRDEMRARGIEPESESDEDNPFALYKNTELKRQHPESYEFDEFHGENYDLENPKITLQMNVCDNEPIQVIENLTKNDPQPSSSKNAGSFWTDAEMQESAQDKIKSVKRVREKKPQSVKSAKTATKTKKKTTQNYPNLKSEDASQQSSIEENNQISQSTEQLERMEIDETYITVKEPEMEKTPSVEKPIENEHRMDPVPERIYVTMESNVNSEGLEDKDPLNDKDVMLAELGVTPESIAAMKIKKKEKREAKMKEISDLLKKAGQSSSTANNI